MAGQGRGSGLASASLADDPQAQELLGRVNQLVLRKLASPGGPVQEISHRPSAVALDDLSLLTELVINAWRREPVPPSREVLLRLRGEQWGQLQPGGGPAAARPQR